MSRPKKPVLPMGWLPRPGGRWVLADGTGEMLQRPDGSVVLPTNLPYSDGWQPAGIFPDAAAADAAFARLKAAAEVGDASS
jgi:hypothetical protein